MELDLNRWWAKGQFTESERLRLYRKISKMLSNGLPLLKILEDLHARASDGGKKMGEPLAIILDDCRRAVQNGQMFSDGLARWVPQNEQMIILAGEQSGRLQVTLEAVVDVVQAGKNIKRVIISGVSYPIIIFGMLFLYLYIFSTKVIPQFAKIADPHTWRGAAYSLYVVSGWVSNYLVLFLIALVMAIALVLASMPRWRGNARVWLDKFAPYSIYRLIAGSSFLLAFSALQSAGITVEKSLMRLSALSAPWLAERIDGALLGVKSGLNCGEALRNARYGFPSIEVVDDLCVYAEYKGFADALKTLADEWIADGVESIAAQMRILNGFAIVSLAIVIGWLITGFFGIQQEIAALTKAHH
jgi:type II secretory pathway component PulF